MTFLFRIENITFFYFILGLLLLSCEIMFDYYLLLLYLLNNSLIKTLILILIIKTNYDAFTLN